MESSFFDLVRAQCEEKWPNENWEDCANTGLNWWVRWKGAR